VRSFDPTFVQARSSEKQIAASFRFTNFELVSAAFNLDYYTLARKREHKIVLGVIYLALQFHCLLRFEEAPVR
jgi:hypothetical protein